VDVLDERAVDLECGQGEHLQSRQRGVAGAEVVEAEPDSAAYEFSEVVGQRLIVVVDENTLRDFDPDVAGGDPVPFKGASEVVDVVWLGELPR
jgi:hypothetical protein